MRSVNRPDDPVYARFRFDAAREYVPGPHQIVTSGQTGDSRSDVAGQVAGALDSVAEVLALAGYTLADVTRLGIYTTDVEAFLAQWAIVRARFEPGAVPPNTLVQVVRFAHPAIRVEIEASAARSELPSENRFSRETNISARDSVTMSEVEVAAFLAGARTLNVATLSPDGTIHLVAMWFVMHGTSPVFWTYGKSQKARNLSRDPRLSALVEAGESYDTLRGVQLIGTAEVIADPAQVLSIGAELAAKYAGLGYGGDLSRAAAKRVAVILHPARTVSWDHRKLAASG